MYCPAGYVLNPRTRRCVLATGKTAAALVRRGNIAPVYAAQPPPPPSRYPGYRHTVKRPQQPRAPAALYMDVPCDYGQERNPRTGRCVKVGGRTHKKLRGPQAQPPLYRMDAVAAARRVGTDPFVRSSLAPVTDRTGIIDWTRSQCRNPVDPLTGRPFVTEDTATLQQVVRLHDHTCTSAKALNRQIYIDGVEGRPSVVPGTYDPLTAADYAALRASQARVGIPAAVAVAAAVPAYGFPTTAAPPPGPGYRRVPRPPEWQLYIAQDTRSGPEFASVMIVDVTRARTTAYGTEYPPDSIRIDLGFIPVTGVTGACTPQTLVDRIQRKDKKGALTFLDPGSGRWKPIAPFPLGKTFWSSSRAAKMAQLCSDLT